MMHSIQDYAKRINSRINSRLGWIDIISLVITMFFLGFFTLYLYLKKQESDIPVSYEVAKVGQVAGITTDSKPFASIHGKTYTFFWCQNSNAILVKNRIYFENETKAMASGRTLSKLCQK